MRRLKDAWYSLWVQRRAAWSALVCLSLSFMVLGSFLQAHWRVEAAARARLNQETQFAATLIWTHTHQTAPAFSLVHLDQLRHALAPDFTVYAYQAIRPTLYQGRIRLSAQLIGIDLGLLQVLGLWDDALDVGQGVSTATDLEDKLLTISGGHTLRIIGQAPQTQSNMLFDYPLVNTVFVPLSFLPKIGQPIHLQSLYVVHPPMSATQAQAQLHLALKTIGPWDAYMRHPSQLQSPTDWSDYLMLAGIVSGLLMLLGLAFMIQLVRQLVQDRQQELGLRLAIGATITVLIQWLVCQVVLLSVMAWLMAFVVGQCFHRLLGAWLNWPWGGVLRWLWLIPPVCALWAVFVLVLYQAWRGAMPVRFLYPRRH